MSITPGQVAPQPQPTAAEQKVTNEQRRAERLIREVQRAHEWRVQVWAQMELKIRGANANLEALGVEPVVPWEPNFQDRSSLDHYASMKITK